jgi:hypothetical protein
MRWVKKTIVPAPARAPFIRRLFELYATGKYSLLKLVEEATSLGLTTRKGLKIAKSQMNEILTLFIAA